MMNRQVLSRDDAGQALEELAQGIRNGKLASGADTIELDERVELAIDVAPDPVRVSLEITGTAGEHRPLVGIVTGSPSDLPTVEKARATLDALGIVSELRVLSAHRTPDLVLEWVRSAPERGIEVFIACAGMANHLAGTVAAHTLRPVIGVPLTSGALGGLDSLLSTVQMPPGIPVATVAVDGARNAGFLAARILAGRYPDIERRLEEALQRERARYEKS